MRGGGRGGTFSGISLRSFAGVDSGITTELHRSYKRGVSSLRSFTGASSSLPGVTPHRLSLPPHPAGRPFVPRLFSRPADSLFAGYLCSGGRCRFSPPPPPPAAGAAARGRRRGRRRRRRRRRAGTQYRGCLRPCRYRSNTGVIPELHRSYTGVTPESQSLVSFNGVSLEPQ